VLRRSREGRLEHTSSPAINTSLKKGNLGRSPHYLSLKGLAQVSRLSHCSLALDMLDSIWECSLMRGSSSRHEMELLAVPHSQHLEVVDDENEEQAHDARVCLNFVGKFKVTICSFLTFKALFQVIFLLIASWSLKLCNLPLFCGICLKCFACLQMMSSSPWHHEFHSFGLFLWVMPRSVRLS